jgi:ABC-type phosphate/phosphonate transport system substrate-binding protein
MTRSCGYALTLGLGLVAFCWAVTPVRCGPQAAKVELLRIGTSGSFALDAEPGKEDAAEDALKSFIKAETGFTNEIVRKEGWRQVAKELQGGKLHLGVFQGYEFAWATGENAKLRPLALAVNVYPYRQAHVVVRNDNKAADFGGLVGQSLAIPRGSPAHLRLYVERQAEAAGKGLAKFFPKVTTPENAEDAIDDVVDGIVQAAVADRVSLEAYKRRKPGRFSRLKQVAHSPSFPPPLVAYQEGILDAKTLQRFQEGLLNAKKKEKGERLLTLFRLTGFEVPPKDFARMVEETRKAYPAPKEK